MSACLIAQSMFRILTLMFSSLNNVPQVNNCVNHVIDPASVPAVNLVCVFSESLENALGFQQRALVNSSVNHVIQRVLSDNLVCVFGLE